MSVVATRMARELRLLAESPPPGVAAWPVQDRLDEVTAQVQGPRGTVYEHGLFTLSVSIPQRFPFEPPLVKFVTPVYHPNVDSSGRICLDILNMPPKGAWRPALDISTVLASIGLLLANPNPDDGLMTDVASEYKLNRALFDLKARRMTEQHAIGTSAAAATAAEAAQGDQPVAHAGPSSAVEQAALQADAFPAASSSGDGAGSSHSADSPPPICTKENVGANGASTDTGGGSARPRNRLCLGKRPRPS